MIDLLYSDIDEQLRSSLRSVLAARSPWTEVLARTESDKTYDADLWRAVAVDMGLAGLIVPEDLGGAGASYREAAVVCEELGRAVAPIPFLGSAIVATTALLSAGATDLLPDLASGTRAAVLVVPFATAPGGITPTVAVEGGRLTGTVTTVAEALPADLLLVPTPGGLYAVEAAQALLIPVTSFDMTRQLADITFDGATGTRIGDLAAADVGLRAGAALLASEQLGVAEWCLETTVAYLKTRYQFGRLLGSYQALKHRVADLYVDISQARAVARYAAACAASEDPDLPVAVAVAQAFNPAIAVRASEECMQLHGGIGFTWEYPVHLYMKRAKSAAIAFGSAAAHRTELAKLVNLPASS
jgi:alkylation response protein AidB-like acyl-CoA dehydrogenase